MYILDMTYINDGEFITCVYIYIHMIFFISITESLLITRFSILYSMGFPKNILVIKTDQIEIE